jgi:hypothetical protein
MNKPKKECEMRLTAEDVQEAITLWLDKNQDFNKKNLFCNRVTKTRSRKWFLVARIK